VTFTLADLGFGSASGVLFAAKRPETLILHRGFLEVLGSLGLVGPCAASDIDIAN
jgi:hypothetical protein